MLDHAGLTYKDLRDPPAIHKAHVISRGSTTVPVLISPDGTVKFADRACPPDRALYPDDHSARIQIDALIERFDKILGPQARLYLHSWALEEPERLRERASPGLPDRQRRVLRRMLRAIVPVIRQEVNIASRTVRDGTLQGPFTNVYCAATGATPETLAELESYDGDEDIHEVTRRGQHVGTAHRPIIYDAIRACSAYGEFSAAERAMISAMAAEIGVTAEELSEFERIYADDRALRQRGSRLCFRWRRCTRRWRRPRARAPSLRRTALSIA